MAERKGFGPWVSLGQASGVRAKTIVPIAGDRGFESRPLQRRVRCEPDFGGESHRWPSGISPRRCPSSPQLAPDCQHAFCGDCHGRRYPRRSSGDARGKPEHDLERDVPVEATTSWSQRRSRRAGVGRYAAALQSLVSAGARPSNGDAAHSNGNAAKLRAWLSTRSASQAVSLPVIAKKGVKVGRRSPLYRGHSSTPDHNHPLATGVKPASEFLVDLMG